MPNDINAISPSRKVTGSCHPVVHTIRLTSEFQTCISQSIDKWISKHNVCMCTWIYEKTVICWWHFICAYIVQDKNVRRRGDKLNPLNLRWTCSLVDEGDLIASCMISLYRSSSLCCDTGNPQSDFIHRRENFEKFNFIIKPLICTILKQVSFILIIYVNTSVFTVWIVQGQPSWLALFLVWRKYTAIRLRIPQSKLRGHQNYRKFPVLSSNFQIVFTE